jgi:prepilin signal peptidase PulO-like enzyme (type II secretory pathway)
MIRGIDGIGSGDFMLLGSLGALFGASVIGPILLVGSSITLSLYAIKKDDMKELPLGFGLGLAGIFYCLIFISI